MLPIVSKGEVCGAICKDWVSLLDTRTGGQNKMYCGGAHPLEARKKGGQPWERGLVEHLPGAGEGSAVFWVRWPSRVYKLEHWCLKGRGG